MGRTGRSADRKARQWPWFTGRSLAVGVAGAAFVILALAPGSLGGPQYGTSMSTPQIAAWVSQHTRSFPVTGFIGGLGASVFAVFVLLLVSAARGRGLLKSVVVSSVAAY
jgi:hypothetical protein